MKTVQVHQLVKTYNPGNVTAVDQVSFEVEEGELFGLIGPDGAGKTSIFRILTTLLLPDGGSASINGLDVVKDYKMIRNRIGYMPGRFSLYQDLSVEENLEFFATVFNTTIKANYDLIRDIYIQIEPFKKRRAGKLSGGMKQKLALCCALIHRPDVLVLDEPTTGVDAVSRKEFWEMLKKLKSEGITILVSTPYMDEATLCERIALIQAGKLLSINAPQEIIRQYPDTLYAIKGNNMGALLHDLRNLSWVRDAFAFGEFHHITFLNDHVPEMQQQLLEFLAKKEHINLKINKITPTVEDCFIKLMQ